MCAFLDGLTLGRQIVKKAGFSNIPGSFEIFSFSKNQKLILPPAEGAPAFSAPQVACKKRASPWPIADVWSFHRKIPQHRFHMLSQRAKQTRAMIYQYDYGSVRMREMTCLGRFVLTPQSIGFHWSLNHRLLICSNLRDSKPRQWASPAARHHLTPQTASKRIPHVCLVDSSLFSNFLLFEVVWRSTPQWNSAFNSPRRITQMGSFLDSVSSMKPSIIGSKR